MAVRLITAAAELRAHVAAARDPPNSEPGRVRSPRILISLRMWLLPGLIAYGLLATPAAAGGALPCLWRLCFGIRCPGCGLSRANHLLVHGSVHEALAMNWLVVPLWLVAIHSFVGSVPHIYSRGASWLNSEQQNSPSSRKISTIPRS